MVDAPPGWLTSSSVLLIYLTQNWNWRNTPLIILGISGFEKSIPFKKAHWPNLDDREYRISQGHDSAAALFIDGELIAPLPRSGSVDKNIPATSPSTPSLIALPKEVSHLAMSTRSCTLSISRRIALSTVSTQSRPRSTGMSIHVKLFSPRSLAIWTATLETVLAMLTTIWLTQQAPIFAPGGTTAWLWSSTAWAKCKAPRFI